MTTAQIVCSVLAGVHLCDAWVDRDPFDISMVVLCLVGAFA